MISNKTYLAFGLVLTLGACQKKTPDNSAAPAGNAAMAASDGVAPADPPRVAAPVDPAVQPEKVGSEAAAPNPTSPLTDAAERSETGARAVLLDFARALELKRFDHAYDLLSPTDRKGWSRADFAAIFDDLGAINVAVPTGTIEGAAGSSYYTAPVAITSTDKDGRPVRIEGEAVLRRVNDVPGASPDQLRWHMEKVSLDWTH